MSIMLCTVVFVAIFMVEVPKEVSAQVTEEWVARYNGPSNGMDNGEDVAVDSYGNIYVTGYIDGIGQDEDYATIKYDSDGNELWVAIYNGPGSEWDRPRAMTLDSLGNVYVTGYSTGSGKSKDYGTIKYDSSGNELWVARYNGPGNGTDKAEAIVIDTSGNTYVTGTSDENFTTIAYDSDGNELWVAQYNGPADSEDTAQAIAVDKSNGNVYVTGSSEGSGTDFDYVTIKYDSDGNELWVARYNGSENCSDYALDMTVDLSGNVYVTGQSEGSGTDFDFATIKYDSNGNCLWVARYNGPENLYDSSCAITINSFGNVYVTGESESVTKSDFTTVAYDSFGNELWVKRYNGPGNGYDEARSITSDLNGNVYVSGSSKGSGTNDDITTIAYDHNGNELWVAKYNGPGNSVDHGFGIAIDSLQNVYAVGQSWNTSTSQDITTIKYSQVFPNQPPIADAGPDQTIYLGEEVQFNGSASYDPDGTIVSYEWDFNLSDGLWWETGAPPDAFDPDSTYIYGEYGVFIATLIVTDNNGSMDIDTCEITVLVPPPLPPTLYINVSLDEKDVILYWDPPSTPGIKYYLIYRSTSQIDFDFNTVWVNTSSDNESGEPGPIPLRTMWNDTNAAFPDNETNYEEQYYYIIRAVNVLGKVSSTSRTVGKWTKTFPQGVSTFSLPLKPLETMNTTSDYYLKDMSARYIKWMDPANHIWKKHGDGAVNDTQMEVGKGYEVAFDSYTDYTFTGMPAAMIRYDDDTVFLGFDSETEANNLTAVVDLVTGNVTLNWTKPSSMDGDDSYKVYRSKTRDGFDDGTAVLLETCPYGNVTYVDPSVALSPGKYYFMIVPVNETGMEGASSYSIGVWTGGYLQGYDTFGIPLKLSSDQKMDWYCDYIPYAVGMNFYNITAQRWRWHSKEMPAGAFDPTLEITEGYQISTSSATKYTFIGI